MAAGSIKKIGEDYWLIRYDAPRDEWGGRRQKTERFHGSKRQAEARLRQLLKEIDDGEYLRPNSITVGKYLQDWFASKKHDLRPNVAEGYETMLRLHIVPHLDKIPLQKLAPITIKNFYAAMLENGRVGGGGLSTRTVRYIAMILKQALAEAVTLGLLKKNPAENVSPPRLMQRQMHAMTEEEVAKFLSAARGTRFEPLFRLVLSTGLRKGEVLALRWRDVDFERNLLRVERTLAKVRGGIIFQAPKTHASRRVLPLPPSIVDVLRLRRPSDGCGVPSESLIFSTKTGKPISPDTLEKKYFKPLLKKAGLPNDMRFHDLRHTYATSLLATGLNPRVVAARLGHTDPGFTMRVYGHVIPGMQEAVVAASEKLLERCDRVCDQLLAENRGALKKQVV